MSPALDLFGVTERLLTDAKSRFHDVSVESGGGGINVAKNLHRLGLDTLAIFPAGGPNGGLLEADLTAEGIPVRAIPVAGDTRRNLALTEQATGKFYHLVFPGPALSEREWRACQQAVETLPTLPDYLVLSGSLPAGVPDDFFANLARWAKERRVNVVLDTSSRALRPTLDAGVFMAKLNRKELLQLGYRGPDRFPDQLAAMSEMVAAGFAEYLIVTLGGDGSLLVGRNGLRLAAKPPKVDIVCHVGAGDAFVSTMIYQLWLGQTAAAAFRLAIAAAAASISSPGSRLADQAEVARLALQVVDLPV